MTPELKMFAVGYLALVIPLAIWAWWDSIWGPFGVFWYHTEEDFGHMLCYLGMVHDLKLFGWWWTWKTK